MRGAPRVWVVFRCLALALGLAASRLSVPVVACAEGATTDTLVFEPTRGGATGSVARAIDHDDRSESGGGIRWVQPPFLNPLSGSREDWPVRHPFRDSNLGLALDYNRVDELRPGLTWQVRAARASRRAWVSASNTPRRAPRGSMARNSSSRSTRAITWPPGSRSTAVPSTASCRCSRISRTPSPCCSRARTSATTSSARASTAISRCAGRA